MTNSSNLKTTHLLSRLLCHFSDAHTRIIPIYLVHRPSNDVPYATLEEELIGDFVKYSVKDGKEINLMRRDSEAGQKCCAFQHWVYQNTEGNLLVTDMQGEGSKMTVQEANLPRTKNLLYSQEST